MKDRYYRLMIDPGHGGSDPGAVNKRLNIKEKDINLAVGLYMFDRILLGDYLSKPFITRTKDEFVPLWGRTNLSKLWGVHAFMSIHTNARYKKGVPGIEIEVLHYKNSKRGIQFANITLGILLNEVGKNTKVISRGVKIGRRWDNKKKEWKDFYVLKHTPMPAIIVELGFISDDEEALFLKEPTNQKMMAGALAEASEVFLEGGDYE